MRVLHSAESQIDLGRHRGRRTGDLSLRLVTPEINHLVVMRWLARRTGGYWHEPIDAIDSPPPAVWVMSRGTAAFVNKHQSQSSVRNRVLWRPLLVESHACTPDEELHPPKGATGFVGMTIFRSGLDRHAHQSVAMSFHLCPRSMTG